jgi:Fe2+ transport system protein FeoA
MPPCFGIDQFSFPLVINVRQVEYKQSKMKRLSELRSGGRGRIMSFEDNDLFLKLMEMGCVPGETVRVEQIAPLGDPISISVAGYNLSLRLNEADNIFIEELV